MTKLATVILPRGARLEESPIEALEAYTTVESVNGGRHSASPSTVWTCPSARSICNSCSRQALRYMPSRAG